MIEAEPKKPKSRGKSGETTETVIVEAPSDETVTVFDQVQDMLNDNSCNKILLNTVYTFLNSLLFLVKKSLTLFSTKVVKKSYYM